MFYELGHFIIKYERQWHSDEKMDEKLIGVKCNILGGSNFYREG